MNGRIGALKRTKTPNNIEVKPAKNARITIKKKENVRSSLYRIVAIRSLILALSVNRNVKKTKRRLSKPLIKREKSKASQIKGL